MPKHIIPSTLDLIALASDPGFKRSRRYGTFKGLFRNDVLLVYGKGGILKGKSLGSD